MLGNFWEKIFGRGKKTKKAKRNANAFMLDDDEYEFLKSIATPRVLLDEEMEMAYRLEAKGYIDMGMIIGSFTQSERQAMREGVEVRQVV